MGKKDLGEKLTGVNQRIYQLCDYHKVGPTELQDLADLSVSQKNGIFYKNNEPNIEVLAKVLKAFPKANSSWLVLGEGDMIISESLGYVAEPEIDYENCKELRIHVAYLKKELQIANELLDVYRKSNTSAYVTNSDKND